MLIAAVLFALSPAKIAVTDPRILYVGRFDRHDSTSAACQWSATEVRLNLKGQTVKVEMDEKGHDRWQVVVDGTPKEVIAPTAGDGVYTIDAGTSGKHEVRLVKRTEPFVGTTRFVGFETPDGDLSAIKAKKRRLEVIGDSITCGYGNEGPNQNERFKPETENAYMSYASIAARSLDADVEIIAWSGRKMWPNDTVPEIYDMVLPSEKEPTYDFKGPAPDAIVINLATNDFGAKNPDETQWTGAYEAFIHRLWGHYPKARIYAAIGSMMTDGYPPERKALTTLRGYLERMVARINDKRLGMIEFEQQKMELDGIGSDWHPSVKTHEKMGAKLADRLRADLNWK